ncbi:uncharacterized protein LOC144373968 isoform X2 [Ictidomys tridecemlineatus]
MLFMKMDLLNYQYLDKMNNNIGILCYEGLPNSHITHPDDVKFLVKVMFNQAPAPLIRKWRQREIMKPVQDYNTASLLQEMCRRRSHVPQKADFSLVKVTNKQQNVS